MRINVEKTKTMVISKTEGKKVEIKVGQHQVEQVEQFKYLGSVITEDGRCSKEIKCRIALAKQAFTKNKKILCSNICMSLRVKLVKTHHGVVCVTVWKRDLDDEEERKEEDRSIRNVGVEKNGKS